MTSGEFDAIVLEGIKNHPEWFSAAEKPLDGGIIMKEVAHLGYDLPFDFLHFAERFGAGYFGSTNVSSLRPDSIWYRWNDPILIPDGKLLVVSDDETGGAYGFVSNGDKCSREVFFVELDTAKLAVEKVYDSFFDFLIHSAFSFR